MKDPLVVFGVGELGRLFGGAALRLQRPVLPITRATDHEIFWDDVPPGAPIFVAVGEADLAGAIAKIPAERAKEVILIQNELFPSSWESLGLAEPTIVVFWTVCKPGMPLLAAYRSGIHGPHAQLAADLHEVIGVPATILSSTDELATELVAKYALILTINGLGVIKEQSIGAWLEDTERVDAVIAEARDLGRAQLPPGAKIGDVSTPVRTALEALAHLPAKGRTAQARVERARALAKELGVELNQLSAS